MASSSHQKIAVWVLLTGKPRTPPRHPTGTRVTTIAVIALAAIPTTTVIVVIVMTPPPIPVTVVVVTVQVSEVVMETAVLPVELTVETAVLPPAVRMLVEFLVQGVEVAVLLLVQPAQLIMETFVLLMMGRGRGVDQQQSRQWESSEEGLLQLGVHGKFLSF